MLRRGRIASAALFFLLCNHVFCSAAAANDLRFTYTFKRGTMNCTDNFPFGVQCTNPLISMNTAGYGDSRHSHIIAFGGDGNYALGFQNATRGSHYLAIYPFDSSTGSAGSSIWTAPEDSGSYVQAPGVPSLILSKDGNLQLWSRGQLRWNLGTTGLGVTTLEFNVRNKRSSVAGNMILYNKYHHVVWESTPMEEGIKFQYYTQYTPNFVCSNKPAGVQCTPAQGISPAQSNPGDETHRNILSYDGDGSKHAFGFEKTRGGFYLAIYKYRSRDHSAGRAIWRAKSKSGQLVKVDNDATVTFGRGLVELRDSKGSLMWATGTIGSGYWLNFYFETGNLMLKSNQKVIAWESKWSGGYGI